MAELLLELFSEEIPARMQARAAEQLGDALLTRLAPLMTERLRTFHGPRRLTAVGEMALRADSAAREERGPRVGAPEAALAGFLRKHGATRDALREERGFWVLTLPGTAVLATELLAREVPALLRGFAWPKSMRWGESGFTWVRPLQRILCVLDGEAVAFPLGDAADAAHGIVAGALTEGHRVHAPEPFAVRGFEDYAAGLRARRVVLDAAERVALIRDGVARLAAELGAEVVPDAALLEEVAGLVEWPVPLLGRIDAAFMDLPPEVMRTTMRVNQKYFALRRPDGSAAPYFGVVANIEAADGGAAIVAGNERVLRARLSDARFFWDADLRTPLEALLPKLDGVVFHAKLGSQGDRVRRLERLAREIAPRVGADPELAVRAARLCKADLASGMVGEFPELQGTMGRYYALHADEDPRVADAIGAHYRPLGPTDVVPTEPVSVTVALADKLDQLASFFAVDERPTGSGDPFALRRAGLGALRLIVSTGVRLVLKPLFEQHISEDVVSSVARTKVSEREALMAEVEQRTGFDVGTPIAGVFRLTEPGFTASELMTFLADRLRVQLRAEGQRHDVVSAILGATPDDDIVRLLARADALRAMLEGPDGPDLLAAYRRAANILRIEDRRDGPHTGPADPTRFTQPEEHALAEALARAAAQAAAAQAEERFADAMAALAALRPPLDAFFDRVTVNDADQQIRRNRLGLLAQLRAAMDQVADLSKIEGQGSPT